MFCVSVLSVFVCVRVCVCICVILFVRHVCLSLCVGPPAAARALHLMQEYQQETEAYLTNEEHPPHTQFALVKLEKSLVAPLHAVAIASHLDTDISA